MTSTQLAALGYTVGQDGVARKQDIQPEGPLVLHVSGPIKGGKNAVKTTRTGHRYPDKDWALWRNEKVAEVMAQLPSGWKPISGFVNVRLDYVAGDHRRRDMPAIIDSLWHILEKSGVTEDDRWLWVTESTRGYDKDRAGATITILDGA